MRRLVLAAAAGALALLWALGPTYADDGQCISVGDENYSGQGCRENGGYVVGIGIRGQEPGLAPPGQPGTSGGGGQIDCSSVGAEPTPGNYWLYNYCHGTSFRPGNMGMYDCSMVGLGGEQWPPEVLEDFVKACNPETGPPAPGQERPAQACYEQAWAAVRPPRPQVEANPGLGLTGLVSYFWIANYSDDMRLSASTSVSCSVGEWRAVSAQVSAWATGYLWDFGDGHRMRSTTPGAPWPAWLSEIQHTYERSSLQQPGQKYQVRVWAFWRGSFTLQAERERCVPREGGGQECTTERRTFGPYDLGETYLVGRLPYPVQQSQSVIGAPEGQ